ncbi:hypothetical protein SUGI_0132370 [Cryptomeria japonica]|nr:hypothetical protein SUGI_0132370 [Cryptomeria japonica]
MVAGLRNSGKFYERYMDKRDAKLREESITKRAHKNAKLKAMQETLEHTKVEMVAWNAKFLEKQDSIIQARARAEKLRSFNPQSLKNKKQQFEKLGSASSACIRVSIPNFTDLRKENTKPSTGLEGFRVYENPLIQSVPNFADPRKENTKPSTGRAGLSSNLGGGQPKNGSCKSLCFLAVQSLRSSIPASSANFK